MNAHLFHASPRLRQFAFFGRRALAGAILFLAAPSVHGAEGIISSKHNLSVSGPGAIKAVAETEICLFCHTPHRASEIPLWGHALSSATYTPYQSSTLRASVGQPAGASKLCLSCHDGTVALGMVSTRAAPIEMQSGITTLPAGRARLGTDLSDDHPVSFVYDSALAAADGQLRDPATLTGRVRLDHDRQLQCTACHDPHNDAFGKFLVQDNHASALCLTCHSPDYWQNSAHRNSNKTWNGAGLDPWPNTDATTVAANACENCHAPHDAGTRARLLTFADEEQNCFSCHNGNVAAQNIQTEFNKPSVHPIFSTRGVHDPTEDPLNPTRHVECADCHNPHAARSGPATAPNAAGALAGVAGLSTAGTLVQPVTAEFELCYRCHADSIARGPARVTRQFVQTNTRLEFDPASASFHPVETIGKNPNVPSLLAPWTASSRMYCTDCHNNNQGPGANGAGPKGPHGSVYTPILERELVLSDFNAENYSLYALCYKCHDRNSILSDQSFKEHKKHIVDKRTACTTCHDPHGVEGKTHLINFNTLYVTPSSNGRLEFLDNGTFRGTCSLTCHGEDHRAESY
jgi:predicted CXXCH cytochrome family protein